MGNATSDAPCLCGRAEDGDVEALPNGGRLRHYADMPCVQTRETAAALPSPVDGDALVEALGKQKALLRDALAVLATVETYVERTHDIWERNVGRAFPGGVQAARACAEDMARAVRHVLESNNFLPRLVSSARTTYALDANGREYADAHAVRDRGREVRRNVLRQAATLLRDSLGEVAGDVLSEERSDERLSTARELERLADVEAVQS